MFEQLRSLSSVSLLMVWPSVKRAVLLLSFHAAWKCWQALNVISTSVYISSSSINNKYSLSVFPYWREPPNIAYYANHAYMTHSRGNALPFSCVLSSLYFYRQGFIQLLKARLKAHHATVVMHLNPNKIQWRQYFCDNIIHVFYKEDSRFHFSFWFCTVSAAITTGNLLI